MDRGHTVSGAQGTVLATVDAVLLVDLRPDDPGIGRWESLLFDRPSGVPIDVSDLTGPTPAYALATGSATGPETRVEGDAMATLDDSGRTVLSLGEPSEADERNGQWLSVGLVAATAVELGDLEPITPSTPPSDAPTRQLPRVDDIDFGNLLGGPWRAAVPAASPSATAITDPELTADPEPEPSNDTLQFAARAGFDQNGQITASTGQACDAATPIVVGRRPPTDAVAGVAPQMITADDSMLSRHHATLLVADGRLVVVDQNSANGTTLVVPGHAPVRCAPEQPVEVPLGATVDFGGAVTATYGRSSTC